MTSLYFHLCRSMNRPQHFLDTNRTLEPQWRARAHRAAAKSVNSFLFCREWCYCCVKMQIPFKWKAHTRTECKQTQQRLKRAWSLIRERLTLLLREGFSLVIVLNETAVSSGLPSSDLPEHIKNSTPGNNHREDVKLKYQCKKTSAVGWWQVNGKISQFSTISVT